MLKRMRENGQKMSQKIQKIIIVGPLAPTNNGLPIDLGLGLWAMVLVLGWGAIGLVGYPTVLWTMVPSTS